MRRVGHYLASDVEPRINRKLGRLVLSWEQALYIGALPRDEFSGTSMYVGLVFSLAALIAPIVGLRISGTPVLWFGIATPLWQLWVPWSLLGITTIHLAAKRRQLVSGKDHTSVFGPDSGAEASHIVSGTRVSVTAAHNQETPANQALEPTASDDDDAPRLNAKRYADRRSK